MESTHTHEEIISIIKENNLLLLENNQILKKQEQRAVRAFWLKVVWILVLIGLPLFLYSYIISSLAPIVGGGESATPSGLLEAGNNTQQLIELLRNQ